jgi:hypothetical protein
MINIFNQELQEIYSFFKNNCRETVILSMATLFLVLGNYRLIRSSLVISYLIYYGYYPKSNHTLQITSINLFELFYSMHLENLSSKSR